MQSGLTEPIVSKPQPNLAGPSLAKRTLIQIQADQDLPALYPKSSNPLWRNGVRNLYFMPETGMVPRKCANPKEEIGIFLLSHPKAREVQPGK